MLVPIYLAVPSSTLRAAFYDMTGDGPGSQEVPIRLFPAETMNHRRERKRGIGAAAGDHDVGAGGERLCQRKGPDVSVRAKNTIADGRERLARIHASHFDTARRACRRCGRIRRPLRTTAIFSPGARRQHFARAGDRIYSAWIGDDLYVALFDAPGYPSDERWEIASVAEIWIRLLLLLHDGHRDLGEVIENKVVNRLRLRQDELELQASRPRSPGRWRFESSELTITLDRDRFTLRECRFRPSR